MTSNAYSPSGPGGAVAPDDPTWTWETDAEQRLSYLSPTVERFAGRPAASMIGLARHRCCAKGGDAALWRPYHEALSQGRPFADFVYPYAHPDGLVRWVRIAGEPIVSAEGTYLGHRGVATDISTEGRMRGALAEALADLRASHAQILEQNRRFDAALANMTQGLCMFDAQARLVVLNRRYCEIFGATPDQIRVGMTQGEIYEVLVAGGCYRHETTVDALCEETRRALRDPGSTPCHRELADGRVLSIGYQPIAGGGWVATCEDITERRRNEARIAHMARHDALTDLPNRIALREHGLELLEQPVQAPGRVEADRVAMMCLDLDRFKAVNDTHGHGAGDALLKAVSDRLRNNVRTGDIVARLGGDEFAILLRTADAAGAMIMAERLIATVSRPYAIGAVRVEIGMSVGIAMAEPGSDDIERLLTNADTALYHAKNGGRGLACLFEAAMDETLLARRALERDLAQALSRGEIDVHYQPLIDLDGDRVAGFEALMRWQHPQRGAVPPATFIPVADETGLIVALGAWVLNRACREATGWPGEVRVAVNVSAVQLRHGGFAQTVLMALSASGLAPGRLELEITEGVLLDDTAAALETLHLLRRAGIRICMDDFGTGYSSLSCLRRFPFDKIKIDRSFVQDAGRSPQAGAVLGALVGLGASLGIATLAEGVETDAQLAAVRAGGCRAMQGYLFSPPRPACEVAPLLAGAGRGSLAA